MENTFRPKKNAFKNTFCVFNEVPLNAIEGLLEQYQSESGSRYYYSQKGMFRLSNHWGRLANSKWRLIPMETTTASKSKLGFAPWDAFYPDNSVDKLYFIEVNFDENSANYQHKNSATYDGKAILRNSLETTKRLKNVKNILALTAWAKYYDEDIAVLRETVVTQLIYTNKTIDEIKREL